MTTMPLSVTGAVLAAAAVAVLGAGRGQVLLDRLGPGPPGQQRLDLPGGADGTSPADPGAPAAVVARSRGIGGPVLGSAWAVPVAVGAGWWTGSPVVAATAAGLAVITVRLVRSGRRRAAAQRTRTEVIEACDALAAEIRSGQPLLFALRRTAALQPLLAPASHAAAVGGDVPGCLLSIAGRPGADGLRMAAAGWRVAEHSGARLADVLDTVTAGLRADEECRQEVEASLAAPRATARLLAVLPLFGLLLGSTLGGDPVGFLLRSGPGNICLAVGAALASAGVWWVDRLADSVETRGQPIEARPKPPPAAWPPGGAAVRTGRGS